MSNEEIQIKAKELVERFMPYVDPTRINKLDNQPEINAKQCALIAARNTWEALEKARVFEEYDHYQQLFKAIEKL